MEGQLTLDADSSREFMQAEETIRRGLKTFIEVGEALLKIQEKQWFRSRGYQTFSEYCQKEWNLSERSAVRNIRASQAAKAVAGSLPPDVAPPSSMAQVEALKAAGGPGKQAEVWQSAQAGDPSAQPSADKLRTTIAASMPQLELPADFPMLPISFRGPIFDAVVELKEADTVHYEIVPSSNASLYGPCRANFKADLSRGSLGLFSSFEAAQKACSDHLVEYARKQGVV